MLAAAAFAFSGCSGVGTVGDGTDPIDDSTGELCSAALALAGSFQPTGTGVDEGGSCIPLGVWTFNVTVEDMGDCPDVPTVGEYVYEITEDADGYITTYLADPDNENILAKVSIEGECIGTMEHWSDDGKQMTLLRPYTLEDFSIAGVGEYEIFEESQLFD